jgi:predicted  nucleic acid-binding Zn-ribbon protein
LPWSACQIIRSKFPISFEPGERAALRSALDALHETERVLETLQTAHERAGESRRALADQVREAETSLEWAQSDEPSRVAFAFAEGDPEADAASPVTVAQAALDKLRGEIQRLRNLEAALEAEMAKGRDRIAQGQNTVRAAVASLVCNSPELGRMLEELEATWAKLRGLRKAFSVITAGCGDFMPTDLLNQWQGVYPLDFTAKWFSGGAIIPIDERPAEAWSEALAKLLEDPEHPLPAGS